MEDRFFETKTMKNETKKRENILNIKCMVNGRKHAFYDLFYKEYPRLQNAQTGIKTLKQVARFTSISR